MPFLIDARVDPGEGERTVLVVHDLEGQRRGSGLVFIDDGEIRRWVAFEVDFRLRVSLRWGSGR
jgi:hypothetical protein